MKHKIGDYVWFAHFNPVTTIKIPCGVCAGTLKVTLILGNGEQVELPCDYCAKGYDAPRGYEEEYQAVSAAESVRIDGMSVDITEKSETVEYWTSTRTYHRRFKESELFTDKNEAMERSKQLMAEYCDDLRKRADWLKQEKKKSFAWNAGYHMRQVKDLEKKISYHKEKAQLCKERVKKDVNSI